MFLDQAREPLDRQSIAADGQQQFGSNWISLDAAVSAATEHVAPPLQAYLAGKRLTHLGMNAANLDIEGIEREQRAAFRRRHEQGGRITGEVMGADKLGTMAGGALVFCRCAHGTAISAAATRRRSPIMML